MNQKPTTEEILMAYDTAEDLHSDKSEEFIISIAADMAGVEYGDVIDAIVSRPEPTGR